MGCLLNVSTSFPESIIINSDKCPGRNIVNSCVIVLLLPDRCWSEVTRAGEAAGAPERRRTAGESQSRQRPHSASGGESATMCQAAADK